LGIKGKQNGKKNPFKIKDKIIIVQNINEKDIKLLSIPGRIS